MVVVGDVDGMPLQACLSNSDRGPAAQKPHRLAGSLRLSGRPPHAIPRAKATLSYIKQSLFEVLPLYGLRYSHSKR